MPIPFDRVFPHPARVEAERLLGPRAVSAVLTIGMLATTASQVSDSAHVAPSEGVQSKDLAHMLASIDNDYGHVGGGYARRYR
jgi:hypothetical protein